MFDGHRLSNRNRRCHCRHHYDYSISQWIARSIRYDVDNATRVIRPDEHSRCRLLIEYSLVLREYN
jgi:hypothetical protein